jgi:hypothetical protein
MRANNRAEQDLKISNDSKKNKEEEKASKKRRDIGQGSIYLKYILST